MPETNTERRSMELVAAISELLDNVEELQSSTREYCISALEADMNHDAGELALSLSFPTVGVALFAVAITTPVYGPYVAAGASLVAAAGLVVALWSRRRAQKRYALLLRLYDLRRAEEASKSRSWMRRLLS